MTLMWTYQRAATCFLVVRGAKRDLRAISLEGVDIETSYHALSSTPLFYWWWDRIWNPTPSIKILNSSWIRLSPQIREGFQEQKLPKYRHCRNGGGSDPCLDFCEGFVHMHWGPSKVIIHHPEVIISKQKTVLKYNNNQFQFIEINYWPLQIFSEFSQQHVTCCWTVMHQMTMFTPH